MPTLMSRVSEDNWSKTGKKGVKDAAREKVKKILAEHKVPALPDEVSKQLAAIIEDKANKAQWGGESKVH